MSEYTVRKGKRGKWDVIAPDGSIAKTVIIEQSANFEAETRNKETAPLQVTIEKQAERIKVLERFVRDIANSAMPEKEVNQALLFRATVRDAQTFLGETQAPESTESAPRVCIHCSLGVDSFGGDCGFCNGTGFRE